MGAVALRLLPAAKGFPVGIATYYCTYGGTGANGFPAGAYYKVGGGCTGGPTGAY